MASLASENPVVAQATPVPVQVNQQQQQQQWLQQQLLQRQAVEARTRNFLQSYNWPPFLVQTMLEQNKEIWKRFFIIDDSGSMNVNDGTIVRGKKALTCSRWSEQKDALLFHAELAYKSLSPCEFHLLNQSQPIDVGTIDDGGESLRLFQGVMKGSPSGGTPLCQHIRQIAAEISKMAPILHQTFQKAIVIIFTDGQPSDGNAVDALRLLEKLPCWVIIRLCTNEDNVVDYYGDIDKNLELKLDTLDDLFGEADEINHVNPWLTYGLPLQRFREFGTHVKALDMLDEAALSSEMVIEVLKLVLGDAECKLLAPFSTLYDIFVLY